MNKVTIATRINRDNIIDNVIMFLYYIIRNIYAIVQSNLSSLNSFFLSTEENLLTVL